MQLADELPPADREALAGRGTRALVDALGTVDAMRYVQMHNAGGDPRERWRWLGTPRAAELLTGASEVLRELGEHDLAVRVAAFGPAADRAEGAADAPPMAAAA